MSYQESFISYLKYEKRYSSHTTMAYQKDLDQFVLFCTEMVGEFNIKEVDSSTLRKWVLSLMEAEYQPQSIKRKTSAIKAFFNFLMKNELIETYPFIDVPLPKVRKKLPAFVNEGSLHHLLDDGFFSNDFEGTRDKLIITLLYGTGIRRAELLHLKESSFDRKNRLVRVMGKRRKERIIPYPESVNTVLEQYIGIRNREIGASDEALLVTEKGEPAYDKLIYRTVRKYLEQVTSLEKKSPHVIRHSYATHLLNRGADLNAVKELLGHANLSATQIYTHMTFEKMQKVYKQAHPRG